ncbi:hypothetical protein [Brevundimonas sp. M20]|uniref:hypothetical protein n=1 Tax=Brevundimonas sp. M20 TaxID=2591463 RepID=UPI00114723D5|nr:hypothetical protein [Brevundimonas sp. M20]QDH73279.1 hypothetical protein FKQ52_07470 [Brevundimonas sp. M20]
MIRRLLLTAAALAVAACNAPQEPAAAPEPAPAPASQTPTPPVGADVLTANGFGPLRIGMTRAEVEAALGPDANPNAVGGADPDACDIFHPARAPEGLQVMLERGVLTSIWLVRGSPVKTQEGYGIGDDAERLKANYGSAAAFSPHKYVEAPAGYLTTWPGNGRLLNTYVEDPAARGMVFEIGKDGKVASIAAGGPSIQYVEGCA